MAASCLLARPVLARATSPRPLPWRPSRLATPHSTAPPSTSRRTWPKPRLPAPAKEIVTQLCKVDLLVLEDLGMKRLPPTAAEDLVEVFVRRYEKGAIILTTNRPMEDWGQVLGDTAAAGAILDRFLHHAEVIRLQGRSYRMYNRKELRSKQTQETLTGKTE